MVCEATQPNWHQSAPANSACDAVDDLAPGGHPLTVESGTPIDERNFGNYTRGNPPGAKFHDQNANGTRDPLEPGLEGWTIRAYEDDGDGTLAAAEDTLADEATTNASRRLPARPFAGHLRGLRGDPAELAPVGARKQRLRDAVDDLAPGGHPLTVESGTPIDERNFGNYTRGNPPGAKFHDQNANGTRDPLEPGLEGWTIRAYEDDGDGTLAAAEDTLADEATTNASGAYQLDLSPGTYVVCEATQPNWHQSAPANSACDAVDDLAPGGHPLTVGSGTPINEQNSGNYTRGNPPGAKFHDQNANGTRDPLEPGSRAGRSAPMRTTATAPSPPPRTPSPTRPPPTPPAPTSSTFRRAPTWSARRPSRTGTSRRPQTAPATPSTTSPPGGRPLTVESGTPIDERNFGNYTRGNPPGAKFHDQNAQRHPRSARARARWAGRSAPMRTTATAPSPPPRTPSPTRPPPTPAAPASSTFRRAPTWSARRPSRTGASRAPANSACDAVDDLAPGGHPLTVESGTPIDERNFGNYTVPPRGRYEVQRRQRRWGPGRRRARVSRIGGDPGV